MNTKKVAKKKLFRSVDSFEKGWEDLKTYIPAIQEMFADISDERSVKIACLDIINEHLPMLELGNKIENGYWNLIMQSNKLYLKTPKNVTFSYTIGYEKDENGIVTAKNYRFIVEIDSRDRTLKSLLLNNGWEVLDESKFEE